MTAVHLRDLCDSGPGPSIVIDRFPFVLGRHRDCDHRLNHPFVSRCHCIFFLKDGDVWVQDLESTNGTFRNERRLEVPQVVRAGDFLRVGGFMFQVSGVLVVKS